MNGGNIFNLSFKLPFLSFLYSLLIFMVIGLLLAVVFGILGMFVSSNPMLIAIIGFIYGIMVMYAPLDYIYTMGVESVIKPAL